LIRLGQARLMSTAKPVRRLPLRVALRSSILASVAAFAILMAVLSVRMAAGNDPALGPKLAARKQGAASTPKRAPAPTVVTIPSDGEESDDGATVVTVPVAPSAAVTQPAPAPAPVQTTTS
jgi:hypothetical protein